MGATSQEPDFFGQELGESVLVELEQERMVDLEPGGVLVLDLVEAELAQVLEVEVVEEDIPMDWGTSDEFERYPCSRKV